MRNKKNDLVGKMVFTTCPVLGFNYWFDKAKENRSDKRKKRNKKR